MNSAHKKNILHYKIRLLNDESLKWLYKQRIQQKLQEILDSNNIMGKYKACTEKKKLKLWDDEIKLTVQKKNLEFKKNLQRPLTMKLKISTDEPLPKGNIRKRY